MGGHDFEFAKIPDHTIYKVSKEETPKLYAYQQRLERAGLKDPWIRNYVWYFQKPKQSFLKRHSYAVVGTILGFASFGAFVYWEKNIRKHYDHHYYDNQYKLLYQLKDEEKNHH